MIDFFAGIACTFVHRRHHRIEVAEGDYARLVCLRCRRFSERPRHAIPNYVPARRVYWGAPYASAKPAADLAKVEDYDAGDPTLEISKNPDGTYDLTIARFSEDLTVPSLSAAKVREAALLLLDLVPE